MPKKNKTLCVDDLRHAEYYGMQPVFDELYYTKSYIQCGNIHYK